MITSKGEYFIRHTLSLFDGLIIMPSTPKSCTGSAQKLGSQEEIQVIKYKSGCLLVVSKRKQWSFKNLFSPRYISCLES